MLEGLLESWSEYENDVQSLKTWYETQENRLKQQHRIGDQASVQNAMKDCQVTCPGGWQANVTVSWHRPKEDSDPGSWDEILKKVLLSNEFLGLC